MIGRYRVFFDTNVLAYLHDKGSPEKRHVVRELLSSWFPTGKMVVSTQVLQELYVVLTKKLRPPVPPGWKGSRENRKYLREYIALMDFRNHD